MAVRMFYLDDYQAWKCGCCEHINDHGKEQLEGQPPPRCANHNC